MWYNESMRCGVCDCEDVSLRKGKRGFFYECNRCHARVGCYPNSTKPRGLPSNNAMRKLRGECHAMFDGFWTNGYERAACYRQLAKELGLPPKKCHFAKMDYAMLRKAYNVLVGWLTTYGGRGIM